MEPGESSPVVPTVRDAERVADDTLAEACATTPPSQADTGELIRIDELLENASGAVKQAIALRRQRRADEAGREALRAAMADVEAEASADGTHRIFRDARGMRWDVFAVYPDARLSVQWHLEPPYSNGWLCFDSASQKRRISPIPEEWFRLTNEQLAQLAERAEVASPEGRKVVAMPASRERPSSG
jgi:hypothetical protein